ncbi:MAG: tRNA (adenosine(37)-N6)-dimethylallyltransferase MiaA [Candidatus Doudnabacteria bacterium]
MKPKLLPKIIAIVGPTATGKSDLAVFLAKKFNGEIISADSRQVYKGMDLGTGKITKKEMLGIKHYLLDVADPKNNIYNATKFKTEADKRIKEILKKGKLPIIAGGTGFWIDALVNNQSFPDVPPNPALRKSLDKHSEEKLLSMLRKLNPQRAANIDPKNKRRVIRAIEVAKGLKSKKIIITNYGDVSTPQPKYQTLYIGLDLPNPMLTEKISKRLDQRLRQGMINEVAELHQNGVSWKKLYDFGLEYRYVSDFLQEKITSEEMRKLLLTEIRNYAKRQRTWFKRNDKIIWLDPSQKSAKKAAYAALDRFVS